MERFIELILVFISGENCICFNHTLKVNQNVIKVKFLLGLDEWEVVSVLVLIKGDTVEPSDWNEVRYFFSKNDDEEYIHHLKSLEDKGSD